jgi:hypothetical protein
MVCSDHKAWRCTVRRETWQHPSEPARTANGSPGSRNGIGVRRRCTARQRCTAASGWDASCGGARGSAGCRAATVGECPGGGEGRQGRRCRAGLRPDELCGPVGHGGSAGAWGVAVRGAGARIAEGSRGCVVAVLAVCSASARGGGAGCAGRIPGSRPGCAPGVMRGLDAAGLCDCRAAICTVACVRGYLDACGARCVDDG